MKKVKWIQFEQILPTDDEFLAQLNVQPVDLVNFFSSY